MRSQSEHTNSFHVGRVPSATRANVNHQSPERPESPESPESLEPLESLVNPQLPKHAALSGRHSQYWVSLYQVSLGSRRVLRPARLVQSAPRPIASRNAPASFLRVATQGHVQGHSQGHVQVHVQGHPQGSIQGRIRGHV